MLKLLCDIGWHNWTPWYYLMFGLVRTRKCKRCKLLQKENIKESMEKL